MRHSKLGGGVVKVDGDKVTVRFADEARVPDTNFAPMEIIAER